MSATPNLRDRLDLATTLAHEAGRLTLGYSRNGVRPGMKGDDTPVTVADREAERLIRKGIRERHPSHPIVGEEYGADEGSEDSQRWLVNPIDGTLAFVHGVPLFAVLVASSRRASARREPPTFPPWTRSSTQQPERAATATGAG